ncbi:MAG: pyruvate kinase [Planctomycetota bacterium]|jgi:pyruvate kinase
MIKTKIIATLGPASRTETILRKMFISGLDIVRLNFSHGNHLEHIQLVELVRSLNKKMRRAVKIMQDLEGYRIRTGKLEQPIALIKGKHIYLTQEHVVGNNREIPFDYQGSLKAIKTGTLIYADDGKIVFEVKSVENRRLKTKVLTSGLLMQHKGINIPEAQLEFESLTEKDKRDIEVGIANKFDYLAQSFVRNAEDIQLIKGLVKVKHPRCLIFAKVENREALANIDEIIDEADGIIVARGDLGICVPIYDIPVIQKDIVHKCHKKNKPVVVATQMLDSMTEEAIPTRAEVTDVANAILDGATHLLLSAETAIGKHPYKVVDMMNKIVKSTESYQDRKN